MKIIMEKTQSQKVAGRKFMHTAMQECMDKFAAISQEQADLLEKYQSECVRRAAGYLLVLMALAPLCIPNHDGTVLLSDCRMHTPLTMPCLAYMCNPTDRSYIEKAIHGGKLESTFLDLDKELEDVIKLFKMAVGFDMHNMMSEVHDGVHYLTQVKLQVCETHDMHCVHSKLI